MILKLIIIGLKKFGGTKNKLNQIQTIDEMISNSRANRETEKQPTFTTLSLKCFKILLSLIYQLKILMLSLQRTFTQTLWKIFEIKVAK